MEMGGNKITGASSLVSEDRATRASPEPASGLGHSASVPLRDVADELTRYAANLERYPFTSATMNEAAKLAANALRNVRRNILAREDAA
jgi:hypothetical protein